MREAFKITAGLRFGRLVVLKQVERKSDDKDKHFKWLCQCDCGKTCVVRSSNLRNGITKVIINFIFSFYAIYAEMGETND